MEEQTVWTMAEFLAELPVGHQVTMVAKKANGEYAVNIGPTEGGLIDAYHVFFEPVKQVEDPQIALCWCDELFEGADGTYIVGNYGWNKLGEN